MKDEEGIRLMDEQIIIYLIFFILFILLAIYNFRMRLQCVFPALVTKLNRVAIFLFPLIFILIAYVTGNHWSYYVLSSAGSLYIISYGVGQGIHPKGIFYHRVRGQGPISRLAKWEDITEVNIDWNKNKLTSLNWRGKRVELHQFYSEADLKEIEKIIQKKLE